MSEHESLRKALHWLMQQPELNRHIIADASRHFDLSPLDEEFLHHYFLDRITPDVSKNTQSDDLKSN